jgi:hypothetical protein
MLENTEEPIKNGKSKKISNIGQTRPNTKTNKATTQYVLDTTIRKQTQIT